MKTIATEMHIIHVKKILLLVNLLWYEKLLLIFATDVITFQTEMQKWLYNKKNQRLYWWLLCLCQTEVILRVLETVNVFCSFLFDRFWCTFRIVKMLLDMSENRRTRSDDTALAVAISSPRAIIQNALRQGLNGVNISVCMRNCI